MKNDPKESKAMTDRELLKQALRALESATSFLSKSIRDRHPTLMAAIRAALATPAPAQPDPLHVANERGEGWQPIETAPKDGAWLLLAGSTYKTGAGILVARWAAEDWESADDGYPAYVKPTHWMPLPTAPGDVK